MGTLNIRIKGFLKQIKNLENASPEERQKAVHLLAESLEGKNVYIIRKTKEQNNLEQELSNARKRLEDVHAKLELSIKSGIANGTIH